MIDAVEAAMGAAVDMEADQLRTIITHAAGLHAHRAGALDTADVLRRVANAIEAQIETVTMREIATRTAIRYGIPLDDLRSLSRRREVVLARQEAMYLMRQVRCGNHWRFSFPQIGRYFDRDHTTVLHGVRAHQTRLIAVESEAVAA